VHLVAEHASSLDSWLPMGADGSRSLSRQGPAFRRKRSIRFGSKSGRGLGRRRERMRSRRHMPPADRLASGGGSADAVVEPPFARGSGAVRPLRRRRAAPKAPQSGRGLAAGRPRFRFEQRKQSPAQTSWRCPFKTISCALPDAYPLGATSSRSISFDATAASAKVSFRA
jgi:hypothetical protein